MLILFPAHAFGSNIRITEIMYDAEGNDKGREYVEVINSGPGQIDMATVTFFERSDRSGGRVLTRSNGTTVLQPGEVAIIVANTESFLQNYSFDGILFSTSNFALLNAGATVSLKKAERLLHSVSYTRQDGASGNGSALHIQENERIVAGTPSLGVVRGVAVDTADTEPRPERTQESTRSEETSDTTEDTSGETEVADIRITTDPSIVFSASEVSFSAIRQNGDEGEAIYGLWNFGDGAYTHGKAVEHAYLYPGTYITVFQELDENGSEGIALQKEIEVLFPKVAIERIDDAFIRLHNRHPFKLDVSNWRIESHGTLFVFPEKSLVSAQSSIAIPFAVPENQDIFFITAGGGQFKGESTPTDTNNKQEEGGNTSTERVEVESDAVTGTQSDESGDKESTKEQENTENATDRPVRDTAEYEIGQEYQEKESRIPDKKIIIIWIALVLGVIVIALVPLLITRWEKEEHIHTHKRK